MLLLKNHHPIATELTAGPVTAGFPLRFTAPYLWTLEKRLMLTIGLQMDRREFLNLPHSWRGDRWVHLSCEWTDCQLKRGQLAG